MPSPCLVATHPSLLVCCVCVCLCVCVCVFALIFIFVFVCIFRFFLWVFNYVCMIFHVIMHAFVHIHAIYLTSNVTFKGNSTTNLSKISKSSINFNNTLHIPLNTTLHNPLHTTTNTKTKNLYNNSSNNKLNNTISYSKNKTTGNIKYTPKMPNGEYLLCAFVCRLYVCVVFSVVRMLL